LPGLAWPGWLSGCLTAKPFLETLGGNMKETFLPDDPFRVVRRERGCGRRAAAALRYVFPFMEWAPSYTLGTLKSDLIAGITIASLAIPQGISYAKLANLPPVLGLCTRTHTYTYSS
jgi:sulfate transporter 3